MIRNDDSKQGISGGGVKSVGLTLDILEAVAASEDEIGLSEIAARLNVAKPSISRHLTTLLDRGYLLRNQGNSRYRLGTRCYLLFKLAERRSGLFDVAEHEIKALRDRVGQTVTLAALGRDSITIMDQAIGPFPLEIGVRSGSDIPLHASSHGKIALAFGGAQFWDKLQRTPLKPWTEHTVCDVKVLHQEIELVKKRYWAVAPSEMLVGINAISAPIIDGHGDCVASVAIVGSVQFVRPQPDTEQIKSLLDSANRISMSIGAAEESLNRR